MRTSGALCFELMLPPIVFGDYGNIQRVNNAIPIAIGIFVIDTGKYTRLK